MSFEGHAKLFKKFKECIKDITPTKIGSAKEIVLTIQHQFKVQTEASLKGIINTAPRITDVLREQEKLLLSDVKEKLNVAMKSMNSELKKSLEGVNDSKSKIEGLEEAT